MTLIYEHVNILLKKYNKLGRLWMNGLFWVLIKMCDIVLIPSLYAQLQFMRVAPRVMGAAGLFLILIENGPEDIWHE